MRAYLLLVASMLAALVAASAASAQQSYSVQTPWHERGYLFWGNLTWNQGAKAIEWGPDPPSEDDRPADSTDGRVYNADWYGQYYVGQELVHTKPTYTFTSRPVPRPLLLNVSKPVQLEVALKRLDGSTANGCVRNAFQASDPVMEVRLKLGGRVVAGSLTNDYVGYYAGVGAGSDPATYQICRFSMAPEIDVIPEGSILTLDVTFYEQQHPYAFGLQGDHRSRIRFHLYPPEEVVYRYPELLAPPEEASPPDGEYGPVAQASAGTAVWAAAAALFGARRRRIVALGALCLAVSFAGCISNASEAGPPATGESLRGQFTNTLIRDQGELTPVGRGSIIGRVHDDLHIPAGGVHVSVIGTANFTQTNAQGNFKLLGLPAGVLKLRFDKEKFNSFEADVEVKAGFVSRPDITLYPTDVKERDRRPHTHDYWQGRTSKEIMDGPVPSTCGGTGGQGCAGHLPFSPPFKSGETNTVLPGATMVELTLDWRPSETGVERYGLFLRANADRNTYNRSVYAPRGSGEPFRIPTNWEMSDVGHDLVSTWTFQIYEGEAVPDNGYVDYEQSLLAGKARPVTARITIQRGGTLPLEPGHPDRWGGSQEILVVNKKDMAAPGSCIYPPGTQPPGTGCRPYVVDWAAEKWVPGGTKQLEVTVAIKRANALPTSYRFLYKPANVATTYNIFSSERPGYTVADGGGGSDPLKLTWTLPAKEGQSDPEYSKKPAWAFALEGMDKNSMYVDFETGTTTQGGAQAYTLTVKAIKAA